METLCVFRGGAVAAATVALGAIGFSGTAHANAAAGELSPASKSGQHVGTLAFTYAPITVRHSGKCLDVADASRDNKAAIAQYTCNSTKTHQQWRLEPTSDGYVRIIVAHSGKCVDIWDSSQDNTADATQYTCDAAKYNQQFLPVPTTDGYVKFVTRHSGKCLEVAGNNQNNKAHLHQNGCSSVRSQEFKVEG
jgi:hypothetical protein